MNNQHPITPPLELVERLCNNAFSFSNAVPPLTSREIAVWLIEEAYVAGADQELDACITFVDDNELCDQNFYNILRTARRPKPPSLKEQALEVVTGLEKRWDLQCDLTLLRRALEALPND